MKTLGIIRNMDNLGRIVIPIDMRRILNWDETTDIEISADAEGVHLKTHASVCIFCGNDADVLNFESKRICKKCIEKLHK